MKIVLTNKNTGKKILVDLDRADLIEENADGVTTNVVFGGGSMVRNVVEPVSEIQFACGAITPMEVQAAMATGVRKKTK
jgi:hypothetical protein